MTTDLPPTGLTRRSVVRTAAWAAPAVAVVAAAPAHAASVPGGSNVLVTGDLRWYEIPDVGYLVGFLDPRAPDPDSDVGLVTNAGARLAGPATLVVTITTATPLTSVDQVLAASPGVLANPDDDPATVVDGAARLAVPFLDGVPAGSSALTFVATVLQVAPRPTRVTFTVLVGSDVAGVSVFDAPATFVPLPVD